MSHRRCQESLNFDHKERIKAIIWNLPKLEGRGLMFRTTYCESQYAWNWPPHSGWSIGPDANLLLLRSSCGNFRGRGRYHGGLRWLKQVRSRCSQQLRESQPPSHSCIPCIHDVKGVWVERAYECDWWDEYVHGSPMNIFIWSGGVGGWRSRVVDESASVKYCGSRSRNKRAYKHHK